MIRREISTPTRIVLGVLSLVILGFLYTWLSDSRHRVNPNDRTIPNWSQLADAVQTVVKPNPRTEEVWLLDDSSATFYRLFLGLFTGVVLSVILGVLMGCFAPIEAFFLPSLSFLAKIAPTAMLAVFFVLVGVNREMYVALLTFGTLPTLAQSVYQAAKKDVPEELVFKAYTLGATHAEVIWNVIFKQILPRVLDAIRLQVGPAMVLLVAAEWMVASEGFGYRLRLFYQRTDMTVVYVYLIVLGIAGFLIDAALNWTRRKLCPWYGD